MSTNKQKYLVLRGKNKDIYFIQKRLSKEQAAIYGKEFIKKSLETTDLNEAIQKRDEILKNLELKSFEQEKTAPNDVNTVAKNDFYRTMEENMSTSIEDEKNFNLNSSHDVPIDQKNDNHYANNEKYSMFTADGYANFADAIKSQDFQLNINNFKVWDKAIKKVHGDKTMEGSIPNGFEYKPIYKLITTTK